VEYQSQHGVIPIHGATVRPFRTNVLDQPVTSSALVPKLTARFTRPVFAVAQIRTFPKWQQIKTADS
jgi:hypothetical protein